jgi:hypothetical protein
VITGQRFVERLHTGDGGLPCGRADGEVRDRDTAPGELTVITHIVPETFGNEVQDRHRYCSSGRPTRPDGKVNN